MAADSGTYTQDTIARKYQMAQELLGPRKKPITHWAEGLDELAKGFFGGKMYGDARKQEAESERGVAEALMGVLGGGAPMGAQPMSAPGGQAPAGAGGDYGSAIAGIESGGKYDALGPVTKTGDRAYGKYQVMGANIPQWTEAALGRRMSPQEFASSPEAQEAVFKNQFGQYVSKYGPEGAAKAWFAGEKGMNNPNARDQLGTTVAAYGQKFMKGLGGGSPVAEALAAPTQMAQAQPQQQGGNRAQIIQMLQSPNPAVRRMGQQMGMGVLTKEMTRDPLDAEARQLDIATKRKNLEAAPTVHKIKQPDGSEVSVQWDAETKSFVPLKAPQGGNAVASPKLTEQQSKDVGFLNRGEKIIPTLEKQDEALTSAFGAGASMVPGGNYLKSDAYRQAEQSGKELLAVILRKDTGAAVTPQEFEMYGSIYLPKPGDDPATIQQKRESRKTAIEGIRMGLGPAEIIFKSREALEAAKAKPKTSAPDKPAPQGVDPGIWNVMTPEERALWN